MQVYVGFQSIFMIVDSVPSKNLVGEETELFKNLKDKLTWFDLEQPDKLHLTLCNYGLL